MDHLLPGNSRQNGFHDAVLGETVCTEASALELVVRCRCLEQRVSVLEHRLAELTREESSSSRAAEATSPYSAERERGASALVQETTSELWAGRESNDEGQGSSRGDFQCAGPANESVTAFALVDQASIETHLATLLYDMAQSWPARGTQASPMPEDLVAMRELANQNARRLIDHHFRRMFWQLSLGQGSVVLLALAACGILACLALGGAPTAAFAALVCLVVAIVWGRPFVSMLATQVHYCFSRNRWPASRKTGAAVGVALSRPLHSSRPGVE